MRVFFTLILVIVGAVGVRLGYKLVPASGAFAKLDTKMVDQCRRVDVAPGTEDVTIDPDLNAAFISAADRRSWYNETGAVGVNPANGIYLLSLDGGDELRKVSPPMEDFLPHGISLWKGADGTKRLFVVNHPSKGGEFVELFDVAEDGALTHLDSIAFDAMHSPNDVVGVGPRQFYATNDRRYEKGPLSLAEAYLGLPVTDAVYYDGEKGRVIAGGLAYANGINRSADDKTIYIAEFLGRRVDVYDRDAASGALQRVKRLKVNTGPDNIEVAKDGALWIGGHSKVFDFLKHAKDPAAIAPSHVIRLNPRSGAVDDVFMSVNGEINASSVGAVWDNTLIVGAVFDEHVMVCPMMEILLNGAGAQ